MEDMMMAPYSTEVLAADINQQLAYQRTIILDNCKYTSELIFTCVLKYLLYFILMCSK